MTSCVYVCGAHTGKSALLTFSHKSFQSLKTITVSMERNGRRKQKVGESSSSSMWNGNVVCHWLNKYIIKNIQLSAKNYYSFLGFCEVQIRSNDLQICFVRKVFMSGRHCRQCRRIKKRVFRFDNVSMENKLLSGNLRTAYPNENTKATPHCTQI